jgi:3-deoxy-7-phosphoheptulonate synthase
MLVVMAQNATQEEIDAVVEHIRFLNLTPHPLSGPSRTAIGITGNKGALTGDVFESMSGVREVLVVSQPFKLVSREVKNDKSVLDVGGVRIGGDEVVVMAGPCSVESEEQLMACAEAAKAHGARFLRGGAYKPRTSPYEFQGLKEEGLRLLAYARERTGLKVITEVLSTETVDVVAQYADVLQVGARNMQNFALLEALGDTGKPVMLKRGLSATLKEWLMAAEYIAARGNYNIILCERGIRTFETMTRNTLDLGAVTVLQQLSHLPIVVDPSHGIGRRDGVAALARAGVAVGADGIMVEIHPKPEQAWSDGPQSLTLPMFADMMQSLKKVAVAVGKHIA